MNKDSLLLSNIAGRAPLAGEERAAYLPPPVRAFYLMLFLTALALLGCHSRAELSSGKSRASLPSASSTSSQPPTSRPPTTGSQPSVASTAACTAVPDGGGTVTAALKFKRSFAVGAPEAWLASPAVVDLDGDGLPEIVIARGGQLSVWTPAGTLRWSASVSTGRIWSSPVVGDFFGDGKLEIAVAARTQVFLYSASGQLMPGFPVTWRDEVRSLAAGDVDGDGKLELVALSTTTLEVGGQRDHILVIRADGTVQPGFPPNTLGTSGCDLTCTIAGGHDQGVAIGPLGNDASWDILAAQDNAYLSWHRGNGVAFDANPIFRGRTKVPGIRFLHDYALAQQGWAPNEQTANQAHFTNTAPAIADLNGDGNRKLIVVGSVQNAAQTDRKRGVALWVLNSDGSRPSPWTAPLEFPRYLAGLEDLGATNIVGLTNQVSIADLDARIPGLDMVFAGFDGNIHRVTADRRELWAFPYTSSDHVLTGGVVLADLTGDGVPEIVFTTYSTEPGVSALYILDANGKLQQRVPLPGRGAMPVPTVADVDGDGGLDIVISLKDTEAFGGVLVYSVPGSAPNCLPWPTGRGNLLRNGYYPYAPK